MTPEPMGGGAIARPGVFVVHKHAARQLHYDLRLELDGVLLSWAVPKGPSLDPAEKRVAIRVEDHPVEYADFEGIIPDGEYGAGPVIVWDRGRWQAVEDPVRGLEAGKLLFTLSGQKLKGLFTLVRTKRRGQAGPGLSKEWLLIKKPDGYARNTPLGETSIYSGLDVHELASARTRVGDLASEAAKLSAPRRPVRLDDIQPMLAETAEKPFSKKGWIFELKYDGYRLFLARQDGRVRLGYRSGNDSTALFPDVARALYGLPCRDVILDGEVVVHDAEGRPSFSLLQQRSGLSREADIERAAVELPAVVHVFDLLWLEGVDLRPLPLGARKILLRRLLPPEGILRYADHVEERGVEMFEEVKRLGLEGLMAKDLASPYRSARTSDWLKIRVERVDDFVVVGWTAPKNSRTGFGALHLAQMQDGQLYYAGRAGSGFAEAELAAIRADLEAHQTKRPKMLGAPPDTVASSWTSPRRVCEVKFNDWPDGGVLRFPVFLRFRTDKTPSECLHLTPVDATAPTAAPMVNVIKEDPALVHTPGERKVVETNRAKIFWPQLRYTKGDLLDYYRAVAPSLLPYLRDRPVVLIRYPDGIDGKHFFHKDAPLSAPTWLRTVRMWSEEVSRELDHFVCEDLPSLMYMVNLGAISLHVWASRAQSLTTPDWCILDLDPKGASFGMVVEVALAMRRLCDEIGLPVYVKTSGGTGLHLLIPLGSRCTFAESKQLAEILSRVISAEHPSLATIDRPLAERQGRVYLDFLVNGQGKVLVSPYSVRAVPNAQVSTPLAWSEVHAKLDPAAFTIKTMPARLASLGEDPLLPVLTEAPDLAAALSRLAARRA